MLGKRGSVQLGLRAHLSSMEKKDPETPVRGPDCFELQTKIAMCVIYKLCFESILVQTFDDDIHVALPLT